MEAAMDLYSRIVLVVEDEPLIRLMLAEALEDEGYRVLEAETVLEAVGLLGRHEIDAIITDIDLPGGLNGLDLVRMVGRNDGTMPTIVASGGRRLSDADLPGRSRFFAKPYDLNRMISTLGAMISAAPAASYRIAS
jgi:DNA-binding NtrC family response regulator